MRFVGRRNGWVGFVEVCDLFVVRFLVLKAHLEYLWNV